MQPIKIVKARNGYILECTLTNGQTEHYIVSQFKDVISTLVNHFKDEDYINQQLQDANQPTVNITDIN